MITNVTSIQILLKLATKPRIVNTFSHHATGPQDINKVISNLVAESQNIQGVISSEVARCTICKE